MFPGVPGLQASLRSHNRILEFLQLTPTPRPAYSKLQPLKRYHFSGQKCPREIRLTNSALVFLPLPPSETSWAALSSVPSGESGTQNMEFWELAWRRSEVSESPVGGRDPGGKDLIGSLSIWAPIMTHAFLVVSRPKSSNFFSNNPGTRKSAPESWLCHHLALRP